MKITAINKEQMFKIIMNTGSHDINSSYRDNYFEVQPDINKCTFIEAVLIRRAYFRHYDFQWLFEFEMQRKPA